MALLERVPQMAPAATSSAEAPAPIAPVAIEETGLTQQFISDLVLKILYQKGQATAADLADTICLPLPKILAGILEFLKAEHLVEVKGSSGMAAATYIYVISAKGQERAREAFAKNGYVGAAPVPLPAYVNRVRAQSIGSMQVTFEEIRKSLAHLVLPEKTLRQLGPAINSGRSIFLFGPPGTGKSSIAETLATMLRGSIVLPTRSSSVSRSSGSSTRRGTVRWSRSAGGSTAAGARAHFGSARSVASSRSRTST